VNKFVADIVDDEHLVFSLLDFPFEVRPDVRVMVNGGQGAHMKVFFKCPVGHWVYPGFTEYGRAGSVFEWHHAAVTGELPGIIVTGKEVGKDGQVERCDLAYASNGSNQADRFVEPVIGEDKFMNFGLNPFNFGVQGLVDTLKIDLGEFSQRRTEEFQFVWVFVHVGTGVDQFPSHFEQDLDFFEDFRHRRVKFHFPVVPGGVLGDPFGIDPIVLSPLDTDAPKNLYGHLDTEAGLFFDQFGDDESAIYTRMFETHKRVPQIDFLVSQQSDKSVGSFFGVFEHIRGSPVILDDGHVEEPFRYIDTDKAREVFFVHNN